MMALPLRTCVSPWLSRCSLHTKRHQAFGILCTSRHPTNDALSSSPNVLVCQQQNRSNKNFLQIRNFFSFFKKQRSNEKIRESDGIESHYELVYVADSAIYIKLSLGGVQGVVGSLCITLGCAALGFSMPGIAILTEETLEVATFFSLNTMICLGILKMCQCYPMRIYYSDLEDKFLVVLIGVHPFAIRCLKLSSGDVKPGSPGRIATTVLPWANQLYAAPTQTLYLNSEQFRYPFYYNKLLGYVKDSE